MDKPNKDSRKDNRAEDYLNWFSISNHNGWLVFKRELKKYIEQKSNKDNCKFFGIFDINNDKHIGNIKLEPIDYNEKRAKLGILIGEKDYWNRGIGTETTQLLVNYAFNILNLTCVYLGVIPENKIAVRMYEKIKFKVKEINHEVFDHNGVKYDEVVMELKRREDL
ncbi:hypothetical protein LCGC14_3112030 [marine sediment metagenome]|uniref:N-acetyltransferase domain-containing protein n=1 Tax=marine sediment metagenome TaxID=412755 RepID=A0A0F8WTR3_9ZZZZ